jgi:hypothetical protein
LGATAVDDAGGVSTDTILYVQAVNVFGER